MEAPTLTTPAERGGVHLWISIRSSVILLFEKHHNLQLCFLPCPALFLRCPECGHRSTSALLQWADCQVHPPVDSSRCLSPFDGIPWCLLTAWKEKDRKENIIFYLLSAIPLFCIGYKLTTVCNECRGGLYLGIKSKIYGMSLNY